MSILGRTVTIWRLYGALHFVIMWVIVGPFILLALICYHSGEFLMFCYDCIDKLIDEVFDMDLFRCAYVRRKVLESVQANKEENASK